MSTQIPSSASFADTSSSTAIGEQQAGADPDGEKNKRQPEPDEPAKVYVDGHEIEITGDPADGIWIQGMPGEVPAKTGDVLASPGKPEELPVASCTRRLLRSRTTCSIHWTTR